MKEIMDQTGKPVSRGTLYIQTHKRSDGTYINEEARTICDKIAEIERGGTTPVEISPNDSLGQVFGKEHLGRVRGVSFGVCPTQVFGCRYKQFCGTSSSSNAREHNRVAHLENELQEVKIELKIRDEEIKKLKALLALVVSSSSIQVPPDLVSGLDIETPNGQPSQPNTNP